MTIRIGTTRQAVAGGYTALGTAFSMHTGAGAGTTGANEATGGGYTRETTVWGTGSNGVKPGSQMTFDLDTGTYVEVGYWDSLTIGSGTFLDACVMTSTPLSVPGQILVTPTYTQT
ncbi:MAG TPA: hypothetical protein VIQ30_05610 [Pseudonocardia sp.]